MKTLSCDLCDHAESAETFEQWMGKLRPHYASAHAEVMQGKAGLTDEEKQEEMKNWMMENKARFEAAM
jgi:hypothetical protein